MLRLCKVAQGTIVGGARPDPVFNRMARHVEKAATQFDGANKDRLLPNILVFVNHDDASGFGDLVETLTGHFHASDGKRYPTVTHISRRITGAAGTVDLYVWVDVKGQKPSYLFNSDSKHVDTICDLLGIDPRAAVKPVGN